MDNYIRKVIRNRLAMKDNPLPMSKKQYGRRPAIDLAVDEYSLASSGNKTADTEFEQVAIDQMKTFLFAGHDTSSSTLAYIYNILDLHPESLKKARAEHERVFGPSSMAAEAIKARPQLLNELPFTTAIIKGKIQYHYSLFLSSSLHFNTYITQRSSVSSPLPPLFGMVFQDFLSFTKVSHTLQKAKWFGSTFTQSNDAQTFFRSPTPLFQNAS
jgi:hypothetical protein